MPEEIKPVLPGKETSGAFFAALLEAQKGECPCKTCKIVRQIGNDMTKPYDGV